MIDFYVVRIKIGSHNIFQMSRPSTMSSAGSKDRTRPESDSDEDKDDHRARFKSERKMISLKSSKYAKPIPETLGELLYLP